MAIRDVLFSKRTCVQKNIKEKEAGAVYHINRIVLVNTEKLDEYMEMFCDDPRDY